MRVIWRTRLAFAALPRCPSNAGYEARWKRSYREYQFRRRAGRIAYGDPSLLLGEARGRRLHSAAGSRLGPFGITVNSVAQGFIRSNPASEKQWAEYGEEGQRALVERIAMKRLGTAQDIANSVVFFASGLAGFVNGQVLAVDGGK